MSSTVTALILCYLLAQESLAFAPSFRPSPRDNFLARRSVDDESNPPSPPSDVDESPGDRLRRLRRVVVARRRRAVTDLEDEERERQDIYFYLVAIVPSLLAFALWDEVSLSLAGYIDAYGVLGSTPDGGAQFSNSILRPTITGVLVPVISIALATLVSTTVNVLRERQVEIRALVNKEACDLRLLRRAIFGMFGTRQHAERRARALTLLTAYVDQINRECHPGAIESLEELEMSGGISTNELDRLSAMMHGVDGAAASRQVTVDAADDIVSRLNAYRSDRVALLLTDFPDLHWIVLIALSVGIVMTFLLESNQSVEQYLNSIQLRSLFALLVGAFSATATLCIDLDDPFSGSFSVVKAATQVGDLRLCLQEDLGEANAEAGEMSSATRRFFGSFFGAPSEGGASSNCITMDILARDSMGGADKQWASSGPENASTSAKSHSDRGRYGFISTIYFHLLTGPMGASVRVLGDVGAWVATTVVRRAQAFFASISIRLRWKRRESGPGLHNQLERRLE